MRRLLALGCCAAYLAFGFLAGAAHVHEAAGHHDEMRGLHLDHTHVGMGSGHEGAVRHEAGPPHDGGAHLDAQHIEHHDGDALYLNATAQRSVDPGLRLLPAMVAVGAILDPPATVSVYRNELSDPLRGPPRTGPTAPRGPPA